MHFLTLFSVLISFTSLSQEYFQQEVNYKIDVRLDDEYHTLTAFEEFEYINNSPDVLNKIYIHLWPNAYRNDETALAKQQYLQGDDELKYGSEEIKGFIDSLNFRVNGELANWYYDNENLDIAVVELANPLNPGDRATVSTPFFVKIPSGSISRLGHIGQSYQITQWYPKPAVYDKDGWHQMPYLNQGEFYSEYGSFDVHITLPKNYVVGATGELQTESERRFMDSLATDTGNTIGSLDRSMQFPRSSTEYKTIRFRQQKVHDFAWFTDKRYRVLKGEVELPHSKRKVTSWALFTPQNENLWDRSIEYINDATYYYSLWNGDYPYSNVTAVDGTISAGGGMEYPMITVIGNSGNDYSLEVVIVHEVGHNWFYGQLGSNERLHGWMDEGMNTLNEVRYIQTKYPDNTALSDMVMGGSFHFNDLDHHDMGDLSYRALAGMGEDQPCETHSARFSPANYGVVMYQKTGLNFYYLKDYLGDELFDQCMQEYYRRWEFKHPEPKDMQEAFEDISGKKLDWLFGDLIQTTKHVDYKISGVRKKDDGYYVKVKNVGQISGPIEINAMIEDSVIATQWVPAGTKKEKVKFENLNIDRFSIDVTRDIPEWNRQNNNWMKKGLCNKVEPLKLEFLIGDNEAEYTNVFWTPVIAGNYYDKLMLGVTAHNYGVPFNRGNYFIAPMYSFGRKMVSGIGEFSYTFRPKNIFKLSRFGVSIKSFKQDTVYRGNESHYIALLPYWNAKLGNRKNHSPWSHNLRVQTIYRKDKFGPTHIEHAGGYAVLSSKFKHPDHKVSLSARNEYLTNPNTTDEMGRILFEAKYAIRYLRKNSERWVHLRLFGGQQYIRNFNPSAVGYQYSMSLSGSDGRQDMFLDEYYFGRNNLSGLWSQQRQENMGGFRSTSNYGTSSIGMAAANLYFQLPLRGGIFGLYADAGVFHNGVGINEAYQFGGAIKFGDVFGVYFPIPIWMSKELSDSFGVSKYPEKIRFTLNFNLFNKQINIADMF
jgi:hypothetical protein